MESCGSQEGPTLQGQPDCSCDAMSPSMSLGQVCGDVCNVCTGFAHHGRAMDAADCLSPNTCSLLVLDPRELRGLFLQAKVFGDMFIILQQYCKSIILSVPA